MRGMVPRHSPVPGPRGECTGELLCSHEAHPPVCRPEELRADGCVVFLKLWLSLVDVVVWCSVSTPYSYSCEDVPLDAEDILELAHGAAAALYNVHGTVMTVRLIDWLYWDSKLQITFIYTFSIILLFCGLTIWLNSSSLHLPLFGLLPPFRSLSLHTSPLILLITLWTDGYALRNTVQVCTFSGCCRTYPTGV